ncbi:MAG: hypothetical protein MZW92_23475 [Comamonadaceae bacterium]|nr:hypothetical protein [Comamonadaceae bacterium]
MLSIALAVALTFVFSSLFEAWQRPPSGAGRGAQTSPGALARNPQGALAFGDRYVGRRHHRRAWRPCRRSSTRCCSTRTAQVFAEYRRGTAGGRGASTPAHAAWLRPSQARGRGSWAGSRIVVATPVQLGDAQGAGLAGDRAGPARACGRRWARVCCWPRRWRWWRCCWACAWRAGCIATASCRCASWSRSWTRWPATAATSCARRRREPREIRRLYERFNGLLGQVGLREAALSAGTRDELEATAEARTRPEPARRQGGGRGGQPRQDASSWPT